MEENKRKPNMFVRVLIAFLLVALSIMVGYKFFCVNPVGDINHYMIIIILIMVVLVLSESFDNFSIGQILNVRRELYVKTEENRTLRSENEVLRKNIINLSASLAQSQTNTSTVNNILPGAFGGSVPVKQADARDIRERDEQENAYRKSIGKRGESDIRRNISEQGENSYEKSRNFINYATRRRIEDAALEEYVKRNNLSMASVVKEAKFVEKFSDADPIASFNLIFRAFYKTKDEELFFDVRYIRDTKNSFGFFMIRDRIYIMLSKIYLYKLITKTNASLTLIIVFDEHVKDEKNENDILQRINKTFSPAIVNGILKIEVLCRQDLKLNESGAFL